MLNIYAFGKAQSMRAWSRETGIKYSTLQTRLDRRWPLERALTEPADQRFVNASKEALDAKRARWNETRKLRRFFGERDTSRLSQMDTMNLIRELAGLPPIPFTKRART
jgi:hypothetical protein